MSIYQLKSRFQSLLRPAVKKLYQWGVTANQVTLVALILSVLLGLFLSLPDTPVILFWLIPPWMLLRMALNAIDGMLAREFGQQSHLGAYLNELADVVADSALMLPFVFLAGVAPMLPLALIFFAFLTEFTGVLGLMVGASRRYDGPMGKSDRAFGLGLLACLVAAQMINPSWLNGCLSVMLFLTMITVIHRVRRGLEEVASAKKDCL
ncbi:CDP-alcohol phosphatidyltransferase family protein [Motilimonas pumila]|uniref:CDP-alcohol phosphatidyltransferase family protein n=1 Tax=Motilimonas pumila TaxID=2303987 RepID=UPI0018E07695|nr:CDP-alcohol phosphatidyltransferase family protein [Motilimonas pumila]